MVLLIQERRSFEVAAIALSLVVAAAYHSVLGVRVILAVPLVVGALLALSAVQDRKISLPGADFFVLLVSLLYCLVLALNGGQIDILVSAGIFFFLCYWPFLTSGRSWDSDRLSFMVRAYLAAVSIVAISVVVQYFLYELIGVEVLRVNHYGGGRVAFSSIWMDFSFLSLYLASAIPLVGFLAKNWIRYSVVVLLGASTLMTSARTGLVALALAISLFIFVELFRSVLRGRVRSEVFAWLVLLVVLSLGAYIYFGFFASRELSLSGSGREIGYINGMRFWGDNVLVGSSLDISRYTGEYGTVPHNFLIYVLVVGGLGLAVIMALWLVLAARMISSAATPIKIALLSVIVGASLIPSFFSLYFAAFLFSVALVNVRVNQNCARRRNDAAGSAPLSLGSGKIGAR